MHIFQFLLLTILLSSCQTGTDELIGHWHSLPIEDDNNYYFTLDVTDSSTQVNKYDLEAADFVYNRFDDTGEVIHFLGSEIRDFELRNDTLFLWDDMPFIQTEDEHHLADKFLGSLVKLRLPKPTENSQPDLSYVKQWANILVGPLKDQHKSESVKIQTYDMISELDELPRFAEIEQDKWSPKYSNFWLVIYADSTSSQQVIDDIQTTLEPFDFIEGFIVSRFNYELDRLEFEELDSR